MADKKELKLKPSELNAEKIKEINKVLESLVSGDPETMVFSLHLKI